MLHTYFLRKNSVAHVTPDTVLLINPYTDHDRTQQFLANYQNTHQITSYHSDAPTPQETITHTNGFLHYNQHGCNIIYHCQTFDDTHLTDTQKPIETTNTYLADLKHNTIADHITYLQHIGGAKYIIPFPTIPQQIAIDFARQVMLHSLGTPKHLQAGQYLVHL